MSHKKKVIPEYLTIEPNASCQLRCPTCPTTSEGYPAAVGSGYLQFEHFKKLIDQFIPNISVLSYDEILSNVEIQSIGTLELRDAN